ncbi:TolC family outer membrane protein [Rhodobacteraceae bacterium KMM 6894]|nr:TolC family outer membrane protein [Rhodobacteraceae bacterium KMM 6894]
MLTRNTLRTTGFAQRLSRLAGAAVIALTLPHMAQSQTLADALAGAYTHSGLLEQNRALLRAADEDVAGTVARLRPILSWTTDITRSFSRIPGAFGGSTRSGDTDLNAGIVAEWLLYDFGRSRFQVDAAKETVLATRQALVSIEQQVMLRAVQAFMNVQRTTRFVTLRQSNVRVIRESLRAAQDRFEVGEVTRTDVAQAEARLSLAVSGLASAQGDLAQAIEEYIAVVGSRPARHLQSPRIPSITRTQETAKQIALRNHPDMLKAQHDVAAADLNVLVAEAAMSPQITLNGALAVNEQLDGSSYSQSGSVGIQLSGPIYQGGALSSAKRRAIAQRDALRGLLHTTGNNVARNVGNAYAILAAARASSAASTDGVRAARVAFEGVNEEAKLGARTTLDVLNAEQELLTSQADQISAQVDLVIAAYAVLSATGQLTVRDLNLNVPTYDPTSYYNLVKDAPAEYSKQGQQLDKVLRAIGKQ